MSTVKFKNIKQTVVGSTVQPLRIGGILEDGSDAKISISSDGTTTVSGNATSSNRLDLIVNYTLTVGGTTTFSGLNIQPNESIQFEIAVKNDGANGNIYLYLNGDTTNSNYYSLYNWYRYDGNTSAGLQNNPYIAESYGSGTKYSFILGTLINSTYPSFHTRYMLNINTGMYAGNATINKTASTGTITSLTFAGGIGAGTVIKIYRLS